MAAAFEEVVVPAAERFQPDIILVWRVPDNLAVTSHSIASQHATATLFCSLPNPKSMSLLLAMTSRYQLVTTRTGEIL